MKDEVKQLVTAIGAMAETLGLFYKELRKNGFSAEESFKLTQTWMVETLIPKHKEDNNDG